MSATTEPAAATAGDDAAAAVVRTDASAHGRRSWVLLAIGMFQVWLWTTRLLNLVNDPEPRTTGFVVVHAVLYAAAFAAAGLLLTIGWRMRREAVAARQDTAAATDAAQAAHGRGGAQR